MSTGLHVLQRVAVRHLWRSYSTATVSTDRTRRHSSSLVLLNVIICTPVLKQLHWLPVKQRIDFKLAVLVSKSLRGLAVRVGRLSTRHGRGTSTSQVFWHLHLRTQSQIGDRSFSVDGPWLWNNLPTEIRRRGTTFGHYRRLLKAFLFV